MIDLGTRVRGEVLLPRGGDAAAVDEVTQVHRLARYGVLKLGSGQDAVSALAACLGDSIVTETPDVGCLVAHVAW